MDTSRITSPASDPPNTAGLNSTQAPINWTPIASAKPQTSKRDWRLIASFIGSGRARVTYSRPEPNRPCTTTIKMMTTTTISASSHSNHHQRQLQNCNGWSNAGRMSKTTPPASYSGAFSM